MKYLHQLPLIAHKGFRSFIPTFKFKGSSAGSYSDSAGIEVIRRHVADYIKERDGGIPSNWENIILCAGASEGIRVCFCKSTRSCRTLIFKFIP